MILTFLLLLLLLILIMITMIIIMLLLINTSNTIWQARAGWKVEDLDIVEANEAFAAQALAVFCKLPTSKCLRFLSLFLIVCLTTLFSFLFSCAKYLRSYLASGSTLLPLKHKHTIFASSLGCLFQRCCISTLT